MASNGTSANPSGKKNGKDPTLNMIGRGTHSPTGKAVKTKSVHPSKGSVRRVSPRKA